MSKSIWMTANFIVTAVLFIMAIYCPTRYKVILPDRHDAICSNSSINNDFVLVKKANTSTGAIINCYCISNIEDYILAVGPCGTSFTPSTTIIVQRKYISFFEQHNAISGDDDDQK